MKTIWVKLMGVLFVVCMCFLAVGNPTEAKAKKYTISTKTTPIDKKIKKKKTYNKNTKHYYTIQSYLNKLSKKGGTLKLKKGTYKIPCTLYVPSNVKIQCNSGVKLLKTSKTGTKKLKSTKFMFQLISESKSKKKAKTAKYKASANVSIKGSGTVKIDMGKISGATAIYAGHAKGFTVSNIQFRNKNNSNYIWIEGSNNVSVTKCKFYGGTDKTSVKSQLAIRLETINKTINGFSGKWSKMDNTVNNKINISGNTFYAMNSCIGTTKHVSVSGKGVSYQKGISITGNTFRDTAKYVVYGIDWYTPSITGNKMIKTAGKAPAVNFVRGLGMVNPLIKSNIITSCEYAMYFDTAKNSGSGSTMAPYTSVISPASALEMENNTISNLTHYYVPLNGARLFYFKNKTDKNFTISMNTLPYREKYMDEPNYASKKVYYVFRSYMEQLEYAGGGTVTVEPGTYEVTNNICIPSNVIVNLKDGVIMRKGTNKTADVAYAKSVFTLVPPSKDGTKATVTGYNGSNNVKLLGTGSARIDCADVVSSMAIVMGHTRNVTIRGITFTNQNGLHFIELNSSNNVVVENCSFIVFRPDAQKRSYKECINVDGTDEVTEGFNYDWSAHDKTVCKDIYIRNNSFRNIGTAVGSHTYSANGSQLLYHENVQVTGNVIDNTYNAAVRALNWKNCVIRDNIFKNTQSLEDGKLNDKGNQTRYVAVFLRGVINPLVTKNTFDTLHYYPIRVTLTCEATTDEAVKAGYPDTVCSISEDNWKMMEDNNVFNISDEKYQYIVIRENENSTDSKSDKRPIGEKKDEDKDPVNPSGSAVKIAE